MSNLVSTFNVASRSDPNVTHAVTLWDDDTYSCTCKFFVYRLAGTGMACFHIVTAVKENNLPASSIEQRIPVEQVDFDNLAEEDSDPGEPPW